MDDRHIYYLTSPTCFGLLGYLREYLLILQEVLQGFYIC
jgi:hypothetical protein